MIKNAFIIHGIYGTSEDNWQPWLKTQLESIGITVFVPQFPTPEGHNLQNWVKVFEEYRKYINEETIIIGHSMAPAFILSVLETLDFPVEGSFFVAPFIGSLNFELDELNKTFTEKEFDWDKIKVNCKRFYIYSSDNDEYVPLEKGEFLAEKLNAVYKVVPNAGHFNKKAGYTEFQQLFDDIQNIFKQESETYMIKQIQPEDFTPTIGAYSHGITVPLPGADLIFVTGQIAMDASGNVVAPGNAEKQAEFVFENIGKILNEAGASFKDVVKAQIFVTNMEHFPQISAVRNRYFGESKPVSTLVEVSRLVKEGCCVEIEVIAVKLKNI